MNAKQKLHQAQMTEWAARFAEKKASGLTIRQWCEQNNFSIHKYNYWRHQLKEEVVDHMLPEIVQISVPSPQPSSSNTMLAENHHIGSAAAVRANRTNRAIRTNANVRLCIDGVAIELEPSVSEEFLRTLVRAVHYA